MPLIETTGYARNYGIAVQIILVCLIIRPAGLSLGAQHEPIVAITCVRVCILFFSREALEFVFTVTHANGDHKGNEKGCCNKDPQYRRIL